MNRNCPPMMNRSHFCQEGPFNGRKVYNREFQIDNDSKESVHTGLETLTHLIRNRKLLLSAHESH